MNAMQSRPVCRGSFVGLPARFQNSSGSAKLGGGEKHGSFQKQNYNIVHVLYTVPLHVHVTNHTDTPMVLVARRRK